MIKPDRILTEMDKHAAEFDFPVLDNAYIEFGAARLTVFLGPRDWLIVFEVLGFSVREIEFVDDLYAFGSCVERQGFIAEEIPISSAPERPLFDPITNEPVADWNSWSIRLRGETLSFSPTREEYERAGIMVDRPKGPGTISEIEVLRFLINRFGAQQLMLDDQAILDHFPRCSKMSKFIQTIQWHHPDVAGGEKPSETISMRSLLQAMTDQNASIFDCAATNTFWQSWATK
jgi:hypothetical protein